MASSFGRWESDPLFSAAEVVQDSADRMESVYRLLLHEETLLQGDTSDSKLLTSVQFHRRDLATTLETTKWQLEDFEKAVQVATLSDTDISKSRTNAISNFKKFIQAIREQIFQVEKSLENMPSEDLDKDRQMMNLNDHEVDGLAQFLYGGDFKGHHIQHDSDSNLSCRGDTTALSDGIVEVESKDIKNLLAKNGRCVNHNETAIGSRYSAASDFDHVYLGEMEEENSTVNPQRCDLEAGNCNTKCFSAKSKSMDPVFRSLRSFWFTSMNKLTRSFTKRRKDGDASYEYIADDGWRQSSGTDVSAAEQFLVRINALRRSLNSIQYSLFSVRIRMTALVAFALTVVGLLAFRIV